MEISSQANSRQYKRYFVDIGRLYKIKRVRVYTEIVFSLATISFFLVFAIKPTLITITELMKTIQDQKEVVNQLQNKINALGVAQSEYNSLGNDLYLIDEALPKNSQVSTLIKQIEALALQSGVTLESMKFDPVTLRETGAGLKEIDFSLVASGDYQSLKSFLQIINSLRRIVNVEAFSFKIKTAENQLLTLGISGKAYYLSANEKQL